MSIAQSSNFWNPWTLSNQGSPWVPWVPAHLISLEAFGKYGAWAEALQLLQEMCHDWKGFSRRSEDSTWRPSENDSMKLWMSFGETSLKMGFLHESLGIMLNDVYAPQNKRLVSFSWKLLDRFWNRPTCPACSTTWKLSGPLPTRQNVVQLYLACFF